jgi:hypothetical protein
MCPVCIATAALIAGKVTSTGGLAAIGIKRFSTKNNAGKNPGITAVGPSRTENGEREISAEESPRRT